MHELLNEFISVCKEKGLDHEEVINKFIKSFIAKCNSKPQPNITPLVEVSKPMIRIKIGDTIISSASYTGVLMSFVETVTPRKIYSYYVGKGTEDNKTALVQKTKNCDRDVAYNMYTDKDGKSWFIYKCLSSKSVKDLILSLSNALGINYELLEDITCTEEPKEESEEYNA